ncbi:MAG: ribonuclease D [Phototrophicaceae bacterium]
MLPPFIYVDRQSTFDLMLEDLLQQSLIAVDIESNGLHVYREHVCLIQLSTREHDYIVDPLRKMNLEGLAQVFADRTIEKIFHASEYDLISLKRDYGFGVHHLFDTMVAARMLGHASLGLDRMLAIYLEVDISKKHQRDDWGMRPLPESNLRYAQQDTHYLPQLRDRMRDALIEMGRLSEFEEICIDCQTVQDSTNNFDPEGYWKIGLPQRLNLRAMAILKELYLWREQLAEERNLPPFKILSNKVLVDIAQNAPRNTKELHNLSEVSATIAKRYGSELLHQVKRGTQAPLPTKPPTPEAPTSQLSERYYALQQWRKNRGEARGVSSDIVLSKDEMWQLAVHMPTTVEQLAQVTGLGTQRLALYAEDILKLLQGMEGGDV